MLEKTYRCSSCGFTFRLSLIEKELATAIPCPGCGETTLEEFDGAADTVMMSHGAECSGNCQCCPSHGSCESAVE